MQAGVSRRFWKASTTSRGSTSELLERTQRGDHLPERLRVERVQPRAAQAATADEAICARPARSPPGSTRVFGERYFIEIQNNGLEIQRLAAGSGRRGGQADGPAAGGHERRPLRRPRRRRRPGRAAVHQHGQVPHRHQPDADGGRPVLPPQPGGNVRRISRAGRRRRPQPADRRHASTSSWSWASGTSRRFTLPAGEDGRRLPARAVRRRACKERYAGDAEMLRRRRAVAESCCERLDRELDVINKLGFPELLPDRVGFRALRPRARHSGHGPRLRRRVAGLLRARISATSAR